VSNTGNVILSEAKDLLFTREEHERARDARDAK
jgi:hypothetical protein